MYASGGWFTLPNGYSTSVGMVGYNGNFISDGVGNPHTNQVWGGGRAFIRLANVCPSGYTNNGTNCEKTVKVCPDASWSDNGGNCTKVTPIVSVTSYYCPATYSDMGTYCKKTIQICPDPSWTSATATTCSKVIQVCPDASWTDNGTNCKKNVPEYKLFSTF